jgi:hypothetical protein
MAPDYAQRRRVALAVAITAIAAPAAFLLDRDGDEPEQVVTTVVGSVVSDATVPPATEPDRSSPRGTDPMGTTPPAFLEPSGTIAPDEPATIAIPRLPHAVQGRATFTRSIKNVASCQVKPSVGAPFGRAITVTNLDNSRSVQCIYDVGGADIAHEVVLNADAYSQIADLTDVPVPVQLTW